MVMLKGKSIINLNI